jgi:Competence protein CoiA-like family
MLTALVGDEVVEVCLTTERGLDGTCRGCGSSVHAKPGHGGKTPHWAHDSLVDCDWAREETAEHLRLKAQAAFGLRTSHPEAIVQVEKVFGGGERRCDVYFASPQSWLAVEIQHSSIEPSTVGLRGQIDRKNGAASTLWVWTRQRSKRLLRHEVLSGFWYRPTLEAGQIAAVAESGGTIYVHDGTSLLAFDVTPLRGHRVCVDRISRCDWAIDASGFKRIEVLVDRDAEAARRARRAESLTAIGIDQPTQGWAWILKVSDDELKDAVRDGIPARALLRCLQGGASRAEVRLAAVEGHDLQAYSTLRAISGPGADGLEVGCISHDEAIAALTTVRSWKSYANRRKSGARHAEALERCRKA